MKYTFRYMVALIVLITSLCGAAARGQRILSVDVQPEACLNDSVPVSIGFSYDREVVVRGGETTLSHPGRAFLPDGKPCGALGCSYRSSVTFDAFATGAHISTIQDIKYVRLNIEHSYIGDVYIGIVCPNGQRAALMNWKGTGTSDCDDEVPEGHRLWNGGSNVAGGTFLGDAYDVNGYPACDSTVSSNAPGIGWNYCWSNNTNSGYQYAPGDGIIYRSTNEHNGKIDSSNVAAGTNFYHPNQNFNSLVGCPLNGEWYIEVIDAYSGDNGWIFDWELSLNPSLLPTANDIAGRYVTGDAVTVVDDSTYIVSAPEGTTGDTTVTYGVHVTTTHGDVLDTTFTVHYTPLFHTVVDDTLCMGDTAWWAGTAYTRDTAVHLELSSVRGCDSIVDLAYTFLPTYDLTDTVLFCPDQLTYYHGQWWRYFNSTLIPYANTYRTVDGCDSIIHMATRLLDSGFSAHLLLSDDGEVWREDTMLAGCAPYDMSVRDSSQGAVHLWWDMGDGYTATDDTLLSHTYEAAGVYDITLVAEAPQGCRDTVTRKYAVTTFEVPQAEFDWERDIPGNHRPEVQFINQSSPAGLYYLWEIGNGSGTDTTSEENPFYHWGEPQDNMEGEYTVRLIATWLHPFGSESDSTLVMIACSDTVEHEVTVTNVFLQFPDLVTPNGDGINDRWEVVNLLEYGHYSMNEVWIYDAWGALVYHARDIRRVEDFWDPNETRSPDGTYYFRFSGRGEYGIVKRNGIIEVIR